MSDIIASGKWLDSGGKGPLPAPAPIPVVHIDGAYCVVLEITAGGERYQETLCVLRKRGGGVDIAWDISSRFGWEEHARDIIRPE